MGSEQQEEEAVVLVPGLFLGGVSMAALQHRLRRCGFETHRFAYFSALRSPRDNAARLDRFLQSLANPVVHLVGHSLGGLLVRHLFFHYPNQRLGRIVTLGTPHRGSFVARELIRIPALRLLLGASLDQGLLGNVPGWKGTRALGVIAGTRSLGAGALLPGLPKPNDGTVAMEETNLPGMDAHVQLPVTHTGMLISPTVAEFVCVYLKTGHFPRPG